LVEVDPKALQQMFPEIPSWVKNPDYDRVCYSLQLYALCTSVYPWNQKCIVCSTENW